MKSKKQTISNSFGKKEKNEQNDNQNSLSRRSFMKQSLAASAGVVCTPVLIHLHSSKQRLKPLLK